MIKLIKCTPNVTGQFYFKILTNWDKKRQQTIVIIFVYIMFRLLAMDELLIQN